MRILVTGSEGFLGRNLVVRLRARASSCVVGIGRQTTAKERAVAAEGADFVFHLAGVNRPADEAEFATGNAGVTGQLCDLLAASGRAVPIVYASSTQATLANPYGQSKRAAEEELARHAGATGAAVSIFRLTNVFGKWARPHYNSAVATFCHQIAAGGQPSVHDPSAPLHLVYVDDVIDAFVRMLDVPQAAGGCRQCTAGPVHATTVGEVAAILTAIHDSRRTLLTPPVGRSLARALHATYLSVLEPTAFTYDIARHTDVRGTFVEMVKTVDSGQVGYFTAHPGVTRGGHYHHTKTEKFLVLAGTALFRFRHILSGATSQTTVEGGSGRIVETVPGWAHDVTNVGSGELIVMLWASEVFDRERPDTIAWEVAP